MEDPKYALVVDLVTLLVFICFSMAFFHAKSGPNQRMRRLLTGVWPYFDYTRRTVPSLTRVSMIVLTCVALGYVVLNLWSTSIAYGGLDRALVRFYALTPEADVSPWLMRISKILYWVSIMFVFVLRLNYALYRRGLILMWIALLANLFVAFPAGSAGAFMAPVVAFVVADLLSALHLNRSLRPRLDTSVLVCFVVCGAMLLLVIRDTKFKNISQAFDVVSLQRHDVAGRLFSSTSHSHRMVPEYTAFCMRTFGRSQDFLPGHTFYSILVNPIPREMWPSKPISFGRILGQIRQGEYGTVRAKPEGWSIAAGLAGEGYANGGYCGIVVLSLAVGYLCGKAAKCAAIGFFMPSYPVLMMALGLYRFSYLFVRGDVHAAWTSTVYPLIVLVFVLWTSGCFVSFMRAAVRGYRLDRRTRGGACCDI